MSGKWDWRFLGLAAHVAGWSKDPSTGVGAVIVDRLRKVQGMGYNGFPRGVLDLETRLQDRPTKYAFTVHAEANAILSAGHAEGCTLYGSLFPCAECAKLIVQAGLARVVAPVPLPEHVARWGSSFEHSQAMFAEAGVEVSLLGL